MDIPMEECPAAAPFAVPLVDDVHQASHVFRGPGACSHWGSAGLLCHGRLPHQGLWRPHAGFYTRHSLAQSEVPAQLACMIAPDAAPIASWDCDPPDVVAPVV